MATLPTNEKKELILDVTSDFACPWCYVGYARFNNALIEFKNKYKIDPLTKIEINWHPYMIDVGTKKSGEPFLAYNQRRWGSDDWFTYGCKKDGKKDGCNFAGFGRENKDSFWAHTLNAHIFMWFFSKENIIIKNKDKKINNNNNNNNKNNSNSNDDDDDDIVTGLDMLNKNFNLTQHELKGIILKYYYENGVNISLIENLTKLAKSLQMDNKSKTCNIDFIQFLETTRINKRNKSDNETNDKNSDMLNCKDLFEFGYQTVTSQDKQAKKSGINGVPYFFIRQVNGNKNHILWKGSGAQKTKLWMSILEQLLLKQ